MALVLQPLDLAALGLFLVAWLFYEPFITWLGRRGRLINTDMTVIRTAWMRNMAGRANRFMDGQLLGQALNSTSFFTSSNLILIAAIGGALFGGERTFRSASSLALVQTSSRALFEAQLALVLVCLARGLLDLIWTIRQLNYCIAAVGAVPVEVAETDQRLYGDVTARLLNPALSSFNKGVRAYYFALAAAAWLFGAPAFLLATVGAVALLLWRQRASPTAKAVADLRRLLERDQDRPSS